VHCPAMNIASPREWRHACTMLSCGDHNHATMCRAWQLFDWVRGLPEDHALARLCDADSYTTMIALCGPWQQLRRALQLIADMRTQGIECGVQVCWCGH
jgi:pentatricopeptide repeat protein